MSDLSQHITTTQTTHCCPRHERPHRVVEYRRQKEIDYLCYAAWLPNVRILVPHVPDNILLDYIRRAAIEFATRTAILTRNISLDIQDGVADYWPCLGGEERIERVRLLSIGGHCYRPVGHTCSWELSCGHFWFHPPNSLEIHPPPRECATVILTVDAVPSETSSQCDHLLHDRYFEAIAAYAAAQAALIPPMDDSDNIIPQNAGLYQMHMGRFNAGVNRAKVDQAKHFSDTVQSWGQHDR